MDAGIIEIVSNFGSAGLLFLVVIITLKNYSTRATEDRATWEGESDKNRALFERLMNEDREQHERELKMLTSTFRDVADRISSSTRDLEQTIRGRSGSNGRGSG